MLHYIQGNKASDFTKIHWTLNATTEECKTKKKQDGTLHSMKQGKCFHQDTLDFECYNQGV